MRQKLAVIDKPELRVHMEYEYITVGELGNILMRLQAAIRAVAGLAPHEYDEEIAVARPRFIVSSVMTKGSVDVYLVLAVATMVASTPGWINDWTPIATNIFRRFKVALLALGRGELPDSEADQNRYSNEPEEVSTLQEGLVIEVTGENIEIKAQRDFLSTLKPSQRHAIENLFWSFKGVVRKVDIDDHESELSIRLSEPEGHKPRHH